MSLGSLRVCRLERISSSGGSSVTDVQEWGYRAKPSISSGASLNSGLLRTADPSDRTWWLVWSLTAPTRPSSRRVASLPSKRRPLTMVLASRKARSCFLPGSLGFLLHDLLEALAGYAALLHLLSDEGEEALLALELSDVVGVAYLLDDHVVVLGEAEFLSDLFG